MSENKKDVKNVTDNTNMSNIQTEEDLQRALDEQDAHMKGKDVESTEPTEGPEITTPTTPAGADDLAMIFGGLGKSSGGGGRSGRHTNPIDEPIHDSKEFVRIIKESGCSTNPKGLILYMSHEVGMTDSAILATFQTWIPGRADMQQAQVYQTVDKSMFTNDPSGLKTMCRRIRTHRRLGHLVRIPYKTDKAGNVIPSLKRLVDQAYDIVDGEEAAQKERDAEWKAQQSA